MPSSYLLQQTGGKVNLRKRWIVIGALIMLGAIAALRIALTEQYSVCKNTQAVTYADDLAPTIAEQVSTFTFCENQVIGWDPTFIERGLILSAAAALLCFLLYNFGPLPASPLGHPSISHFTNQRLPDANQAKDRELLKMNTSAPSLIGQTVALKGALCSNGDFDIEGSVDGGIQCVNLIIRTSGKVWGDIFADRVLIYGQFKGVLHANEVVLAPGSHVEGTIWQSSLRVEIGARFNGQCRHSKSPLANVEKPLLIEPVRSLADVPEEMLAMADS
jgi:cytoskeletal protein CcmA (bactofilin family)